MIETVKGAEVNSLENSIAEWMPIIDEELSKKHIPISKRIYEAAYIFVEYAILEIQGGTKDNLLVQPWFKFVFEPTQRWYRKKYGAALEGSDDKSLVGALLYFGSIFELKIPSTLTRVEKEGETSWLIFPVDIQPEEDSKTWVQYPPNFIEMGDLELKDFTERVATIGTHLRSIHIDLMTAERPDPFVEGLANSILPHLETSARHILDPRRKSFGLACWEAHQAVEKSLKVLCRQRTGNHPHHHELKKLLALVDASGALLEIEKMLEVLPNQTRAIEMRMNEGALVTFDQSYEIYDTALKITKEAVRTFSRKYVLRNAGFLLQKLPFLN